MPHYPNVVWFNICRRLPVLDRIINRSSIIWYDIAYCLKISIDRGFYEPYQQIQFLNATVNPIAKSPNVNLVVLYNIISIAHATKSEQEYQTMLTNAVSSGKFATYMQSSAAMTPNATALLHAALLFRLLHTVQ